MKLSSKQAKFIVPFLFLAVSARIARNRLFCSILVAVVHCGLGYGQVVKLTQANDFSNPLFLHFSGLHPGADASHVYSSLGLTFAGEAGSIPKIRIEVLDNDIIPRADLALLNEPNTASSANQALIIRFERPLKKVGFTLGNGTEFTLAEISAFTAKGEFLGKVQQLGVETMRGINIRQSGPFVGLETSHPSGISTIVLDYGPESTAEEVFDIRAEFLSPHKFKVYLPQIVHGRAGNLSFQTIIQIQTMLSGVTEDRPVRLRVFDQTGAPLRMRLDDMEGSEFDFKLGSVPTLQTFGSRQLHTTNSSDNIVVGYASIESDLPIIAHAIIRVLRADGSLQSETGMPSGEGRVTYVATVSREPGIELDSAFAIVNVGDSEAKVRFGLTTETGELPDSDYQKSFVLHLGEQRAFFLSELFTDLREEIHGQVAIWSDQPIVVAAIRTFRGLPTSSQAIGSTQR